MHNLDFSRLGVKPSSCDLDNTDFLPFGSRSSNPPLRARLPKKNPPPFFNPLSRLLQGKEDGKKMYSMVTSAITAARLHHTLASRVTISKTTAKKKQQRGFANVPHGRVAHLRRDPTKTYSLRSVFITSQQHNNLPALNLA
jgi:hypothetical protein